jgi:hypothetical protein
MTCATSICRSSERSGACDLPPPGSGLIDFQSQYPLDKRGIRIVVNREGTGFASSTWHHGLGPLRAALGTFSSKAHARGPDPRHTRSWMGWRLKQSTISKKMAGMVGEPEFDELNRKLRRLATQGPCLVSFRVSRVPLSPCATGLSLLGRRFALDTRINRQERSMRVLVSDLCHHARQLPAIKAARRGRSQDGCSGADGSIAHCRRELPAWVR